MTLLFCFFTLYAFIHDINAHSYRYGYRSGWYNSGNTGGSADDSDDTSKCDDTLTLSSNDTGLFVKNLLSTASYSGEKTLCVSISPNTKCVDPKITINIQQTDYNEWKEYVDIYYNDVLSKRCGFKCDFCNGNDACDCCVDVDCNSFYQCPYDASLPENDWINDDNSIKVHEIRIKNSVYVSKSCNGVTLNATIYLSVDCMSTQSTASPTSPTIEPTKETVSPTLPTEIPTSETLPPSIDVGTESPTVPTIEPTSSPVTGNPTVFTNAPTSSTTSSIRPTKKPSMKDKGTCVGCETCESGYNDGCNDCMCDNNGIPLCTKRACITNNEPYCHPTCSNKMCKKVKCDPKSEQTMTLHGECCPTCVPSLVILYISIQYSILRSHNIYWNRNNELRICKMCHDKM